MDLKAYFRILGKNWILIVIIIVLFVGATLYFTGRQPITYSASASIDISRSEQKQSAVSYYQYDNYYSSLSANSLSDNVVGWVSSPATVAEIYKKANMDLPKGDLKALGKIFTAKKKVASAAVIDISYTSESPEQSSNLVNTATNILKDKVEKYNNNSDTGIFQVNLSSPVVIENAKPYAINIFIAAFAGLLISLAVAFGRESLK